MSFVLCLSVGSRVSLSSPTVISVESANIGSGLYAYMGNLLQLDRFTEASNPPSWSVPPSPLCPSTWTDFIAAHPDQEYTSYVHTVLLPGYWIGFDRCNVSLQSIHTESSISLWEWGPGARLYCSWERSWAFSGPPTVVRPYRNPF